MVNLAVFAIAAFVGWQQQSFAAFILTYLGLALVIGLLTAAVTRNVSGLSTTAPVRMFKNAIGFLVVASFLAWVYITLAVYIVPRLHTFSQPASNSDLLLLWLIACGGFAFVGILKPFVQRLISKVTRPFRHLMRAALTGFGGGGRFAGMMEEWGCQWRPGQLLLGQSLYSRRMWIGIPDDRHFITIATSRAGKGRAGIIPNLLLWPGSALVIDPKGQNAAITAAARGYGDSRVKNGMRQKVRIVDPFGELANADVYHEVHRFNPLAELNLVDIDLVEQIENITDALVVPGGGNEFWDNSARSLIAGLIAHVLTDADLADDERHLGTVRDLLARDQIPETSMATNYQAGGLAAAAAGLLKSAGKNARGDIIATALTHTKWLDSIAMRNALGASDFSLRDLKSDDGQPCTVYLVLPPQYVDTHGRFLRLFVNLALRAVSQGPKQKHPVLFVLDEFYALGRLDLLAKSAGLLAGYGVKLWPIVQNLGQLKELYPQNWETFLGNAGLWQAFAMNDQTTAQYLSDRLGHHVRWTKIKTPDGRQEWQPQGVSFLRTSVELGRETSRDSGRAIVFQEGGDAFLLRRPNYDRIFKREQYSPDPWEKERVRLRDRYDLFWEGIEDWTWNADLKWKQNRQAKKAALAAPAPTAPVQALPPPSPTDAQAQVDLALLNFEGEAVPQNLEAAAHWYRAAAEQGHVLGQYGLAVMCEKGLGLPQDRDAALFWYGKAADQGFSRAHDALNRLTAGTVTTDAPAFSSLPEPMPPTPVADMPPMTRLERRRAEREAAAKSDDGR